MIGPAAAGAEHVARGEDDPFGTAIRAHPLATLVTYSAAGLTANLAPFALAMDLGGRDVLRAHLARANEQLADLRRGDETLVLFQGRQAYVTPSWYPAKREHGKVVPTWNYVVVQARGRPIVRDDRAWLRAQLDALTAAQEAGRVAPWQVDDAPAAFVATQLPGIVGLEIPIERLEGKWKASQNQPAANRAVVVAGLRRDDPASPTAEVVEQVG